ncbi:MAG: maleylpyruvate isomerase family mycothiol-dependent enzyme [Actinomycetota bacterium]|nr:maleylpyruvate isomerase family mycothiol-dependent enzyme [Actinomycetota bacterium]
MSVELLRRATDYAQDVTSDLTADELRLATPCAGWDTGRVVLHLADVADGLVGLVETGHLAMPEPARVADPDPVRVLQASMNRLAAVLSTTTDAERADAAARAGAIEFTMHGWDIGVARQSDHTTPPELANDVRELATAWVSDEVRGSIFADPVDVPAEALPGDRLAGFLGRQRVT